MYVASDVALELCCNAQESVVPSAPLFKKNFAGKRETKEDFIKALQLLSSTVRETPLPRVWNLQVCPLCSLHFSSHLLHL